MVMVPCRNAIASRSNPALPNCCKKARRLLASKLAARLAVSKSISSARLSIAAMASVCSFRDCGLGIIE